MAEYLKYGATGLVALIILAVLVPVIRAFVDELKASRQACPEPVEGSARRCAKSTTSS